MDTNQIVTLLVAERDRLNAAIAALTGGVKRRGRPPKNAVPVSSNGVEPTKPRGRTTWTPAQRQQAAKRMKAMWKAKKAAKKS